MVMDDVVVIDVSAEHFDTVLLNIHIRNVNIVLGLRDIVFNELTDYYVQ